MGIASLVCGISALLFSTIPVLGCILGVIAICLAQASHDPSQHGFAVGGLTCGIIGLCLCALVTLGVACIGCQLASL